MRARYGDKACWPSPFKRWLKASLDRRHRTRLPGVGFVRTARIVAAAERGVCPAGKVAMHSCDRPGCCNPDHITPDTQGANMADKASKGRGRTGDVPKCRPVTDGGRTWLSVSDAARSEGVSPCAITLRCQGGWNGWRYLDEHANDDAPLELRMAA